MIYSVNYLSEGVNMGVVLNLKSIKKEIEEIVDIEEDKIYFILKFFQLEISEMSDINLTKKEQIDMLSRTLHREISYQTYTSFCKKYIEGKERIRKKVEVPVELTHEYIHEKYDETWVSKEMNKTGKSEGEIYGI